jgi:hypothetical protein
MTMNYSKHQFAGLANHIVSEDSAATEFIARHGENLHYCHTTGAWFIFNITHWQEDETGKALQMARVLARELSETQDAKKIAGQDRLHLGYRTFREE